MLPEEYEPRRRPPRGPAKPDPEQAPFEYTIRDATAADLPYIREIYNHYVANTVVTFDEDPMTLAEWRRKFVWLTRLDMPFLVAISPAGTLLGFAYVAPWKQKAAYRRTVENSIYLGPAATGKGLGKALLGQLLDRAADAGIREVLAVVADQGAEASIRLHEVFGFTESGRLGRVGYKFDRWLGTILLQKSLKQKRRRS